MSQGHGCEVSVQMEPDTWPAALAGAHDHKDRVQTFASSQMILHFKCHILVQ